MTLHRGWCRTWYNGWSPEQRQATIPIQRAALRCGLIARPTSCSICGFDKPNTPGAITLHLEDYSSPLEGFGCCGRCHNILHGRFDDPARWLRLLDRISYDGWARRLSLSGESRRLPFAVTYPQGIDRYASL